MAWLALRQNFTSLGREWLSMLEQKEIQVMSIYLSPLWKRGIKGDLKMECPFFLYKISPGSSFPKRGIKEVYSNGINISSFKNYCSAALLRYCSIKPVMLYSFGKTKLLPDIYYEEE
jgi:hypothetical protein